jgi:hypothetical protein
VLLTFLLLLPRCGRGRGEIVLLTFLLLLPRCGRGRGEIVLLTFLLLLPRCGRGRGRLCCSPSSCCSHAAGEEGGDCAAHLPPAAPTLRERKGGMSRARAILRLSTIPRLRTRSPLSRTAGEGLGVRVAPHAMVVRARYVPNEKAGFLIRFYERSPRSNSIASRTISTVASSSIVLKSPKLSP